MKGSRLRFLSSEYLFKIENTNVIKFYEPDIIASNEDGEYVTAGASEPNQSFILKSVNFENQNLRHHKRKN